MSNKLEYLSFISFFGFGGREEILQSLWFGGHWLSQNKGVDGGDDDECIERGIITAITIIIIMNWSVQPLLNH